MKRGVAKYLREVIEQAVQSLNDETALEVVCLHPHWSDGATYEVGNKVRYNNVLYRCLAEHTAQADWMPDVTPSLWAKVLVEDGKILTWEQPDSTNPYMKGDKVTHGGKTWESTVDNNVWEPGVYGWVECAP